jgi:hypothetical protein
MPVRDVENHPLVRSEFTGQMISTSSEEWRHECEVTFLLALPLAKRDVFLDGVPGANDREDRGIQGVRGEVAVAFLRRDPEAYRDQAAGIGGRGVQELLNINRIALARGMSDIRIKMQKGPAPSRSAGPLTVVARSERPLPNLHCAPPWIERARRTGRLRLSPCRRHNRRESRSRAHAVLCGSSNTTVRYITSAPAISVQGLRDEGRDR